MEIKCKKITCGFNNSTYCMAKHITIGNGQECKDFTSHNQKRKLQKKRKENNMFETSNELMNFKPTKTKDIKCDCLECLFNEEQNCKANGITILSDDESCFCATHLNR